MTGAPLWAMAKHHYGIVSYWTTENTWVTQLDSTVARYSTPKKASDTFKDKLLERGQWNNRPHEIRKAQPVWIGRPCRAVQTPTYYDESMARGALIDQWSESSARFAYAGLTPHKCQSCPGWHNQPVAATPEEVAVNITEVRNLPGTHGPGSRRGDTDSHIKKIQASYKRTKGIYR